jgi:hypothetical protein
MNTPRFKLRSLIVVILIVAMGLAIVMLSVENARMRVQAERMRAEAELARAESARVALLADLEAVRRAVEDDLKKSSRTNSPPAKDAR